MVAHVRPVLVHPLEGSEHQRFDNLIDRTRCERLAQGSYQLRSAVGIFIVLAALRSNASSSWASVAGLCGVVHAGPTARASTAGG